MKYDYEVVTHEEYDFADMLQEHGNNGWELIHVLHGAGGTLRFVFIRPQGYITDEEWDEFTAELNQANIVQIDDNLEALLTEAERASVVVSNLNLVSIKPSDDE